jgi:hypothetical protein
MQTILAAFAEPRGPIEPNSPDVEDAQGNDTVGPAKTSSQEASSNYAALTFEKFLELVA